MTTRQDFTIDAGRDYQLSVALYESDQTTPLNLLDTIIEWVVSRQSGSSALLVKSTGDPQEIEVTSIGEGLLIIHIEGLDTEPLGDLTCEHELVVTDSTGAEATVLRGLVTIVKRMYN